MTYPSTQRFLEEYQKRLHRQTLADESYEAVAVMDQKSSLSVRQITGFIQYHNGGTTGIDPDKEEVYNRNCLFVRSLQNEDFEVKSGLYSFTR